MHLFHSPVSLTPATRIFESFGDSGEAFSVVIFVGAQFDNVLSRNAKAGIKDSESTAQRQDRGNLDLAVSLHFTCHLAATGFIQEDGSGMPRTEKRGTYMSYFDAVKFFLTYCGKNLPYV